MIAVLLLTAVGGSLIKPCIVGTVANTSTDKTRSLGYSIYYTLVNVGGALGPVLALQVRQNLGIEYVLIMSSVTSFALFLGTLFFFDEPPSREEKRAVRTMGAGAAGHAAGLCESPLHAVSDHRLGILHSVLADLLLVSVLCERDAALRAVRTARNGRRLDDHPAHRAGDGDGQELETDSRRLCWGFSLRAWHG